MIYGFFAVMVLLISFVAQEWIQPLGPNFLYAHILLFAVVFFCTAVTVHYPMMLFLAVVGGLLWDLRHVTFAPGTQGADLALGSSVFLLALTGSLMYGVCPLVRKRRWLIPVLMTGMIVLVYQLLEYLILNLKRGGFDFPLELFYQMCATAFFALLLAPFVFGILYFLASLTRHKDWYEWPSKY